MSRQFRKFSQQACSAAGSTVLRKNAGCCSWKPGGARWEERRDLGRERTAEVWDEEGARQDRGGKSRGK